MSRAVAPAPSLERNVTPRTPQLFESIKSVHSLAHNVTFRQAFGQLGLPILLLATVCMLWTTWLIALTLAPNHTANYIMGTGAYDDGTFWLIIDPEPVLMTFSAICLSLVVCGYVYVLALMTILRNRKSRPDCIRSLIKGRIRGIKTYRRISARYVETTSFHGRYRKFWVRFAALNVLLQRTRN